MGIDTTTGRVLEEMIPPALRRAGYAWAEQTCIGCRQGGRKHKVDLMATREGQTNLKVLVSMKGQEASAAEQEVSFEIMCLADALNECEYSQAYIVLGRPEWTLRDWYVSGAWRKRLVDADNVQVVKWESIVAREDQGKL
jgi:hypothetical protein